MLHSLSKLGIMHAFVCLDCAIIAKYLSENCFVNRSHLESCWWKHIYDLAGAVIDFPRTDNFTSSFVGCQSENCKQCQWVCVRGAFVKLMMYECCWCGERCRNEWWNLLGKACLPKWAREEGCNLLYLLCARELTGLFTFVIFVLIMMFSFHLQFINPLDYVCTGLRCNFSARTFPNHGRQIRGTLVSFWIKLEQNLVSTNIMILSVLNYGRQHKGTYWISWEKLKWSVVFSEMCNGAGLKVVSIIFII